MRCKGSVFTTYESGFHRQRNNKLCNKYLGMQKCHCAAYYSFNNLNCSSYDLGFCRMDELEPKICDTKTLGMTNTFFWCYNVCIHLPGSKVVQNIDLAKRHEVCLRLIVRDLVDGPTMDQWVVDWFCRLDHP